MNEGREALPSAEVTWSCIGSGVILYPTFSRSRKPLSSTSSGLMSYSFATHTAAVLRT